MNIRAAALVCAIGLICSSDSYAQRAISHGTFSDISSDVEKKLKENLTILTDAQLIAWLNHINNQLSIIQPMDPPYARTRGTLALKKYNDERERRRYVAVPVGPGVPPAPPAPVVPPVPPSGYGPVPSISPAPAPKFRRATAEFEIAAAEATAKIQEVEAREIKKEVATLQQPEKSELEKLVDILIADITKANAERREQRKKLKTLAEELDKDAREAQELAYLSARLAMPDVPQEDKNAAEKIIPGINAIQDPIAKAQKFEEEKNRLKKDVENLINQIDKTKENVVNAIQESEQKVGNIKDKVGQVSEQVQQNIEKREAEEKRKAKERLEQEFISIVNALLDTLTQGLGTKEISPAMAQNKLDEIAEALAKEVIALTQPDGYLDDQSPFRIEAGIAQKRNLLKKAISDTSKALAQEIEQSFKQVRETISKLINEKKPIDDIRSQYNIYFGEITNLIFGLPKGDVRDTAYKQFAEQRNALSQDIRNYSIQMAQQAAEQAKQKKKLDEIARNTNLTYQYKIDALRKQMTNLQIAPDMLTYTISQYKQGLLNLILLYPFDEQQLKLIDAVRFPSDDEITSYSAHLKRSIKNSIDGEIKSVGATVSQLIETQKPIQDIKQAFNDFLQFIDRRTDMLDEQQKEQLLEEVRAPISSIKKKIETYSTEKIKKEAEERRKKAKAEAGKNLQLISAQQIIDKAKKEIDGAIKEKRAPEDIAKIYKNMTSQVKKVFNIDESKTIGSIPNQFRTQIKDVAENIKDYADGELIRWLQDEANKVNTQETKNFRQNINKLDDIKAKFFNRITTLIDYGIPLSIDDFKPDQNRIIGKKQIEILKKYIQIAHDRLQPIIQNLASTVEDPSKGEEVLKQLADAIKPQEAPAITDEQLFALISQDSTLQNLQQKLYSLFEDFYTKIYIPKIGNYKTPEQMQSKEFIDLKKLIDRVAGIENSLEESHFITKGQLNQLAKLRASVFSS